jgi:hypothetical protein
MTLNMYTQKISDLLDLIFPNFMKFVKTNVHFSNMIYEQL